MSASCNPIDIPYRFSDMSVGPFWRGVIREAADPSLILYKDRYYVFPSMSGGFWHSKDLAGWEFVATPALPTYDYAPDVREIDGHLVVCASRSVKPCPFFRTTDPLSGEWEKNAGTFAFFDPNLFQDDDGRVYLYWGTSNTKPIQGQELDRTTLERIGDAVPLIGSDVSSRGWERPGEDHQLDQGTGMGGVMQKIAGTAPYIEGVWLTKHEGIYYLQYAAPGTQLNTYADGYYTSESPLGPFTYSPHSPFSSKPGGFMTAAGHGSTIKDRHGNWWHMATMRVSVQQMFERRLGLWPAGFDQDGVLFCNQEFADYPMTVPDCRADPWSLSAKAMLLSYRRPVTVSSADPGHGGELAVNEDARTWWVPSAAAAGEWISIELPESSTVSSVQVNLADHEVRPPKPRWSQTRQTLLWRRRIDLTEPPVEVLLEGSADGIGWEPLLDTRGSQLSRTHLFVELDEPRAFRHIRLTGFGQPYGSRLAVSGLRVFGHGNGERPEPVAPRARRTGPLDATIIWDAVAGAQGYNIRYGLAPDKLYKSWLIYDRSHLELSTLNAGHAYWVAVDSFNENGITRGDAVQVAPEPLAPGQGTRSTDLVATGTTTVTFDEAVRRLRASEVTALEAADLLITQLTEEELLGLLDGDVPARSMTRLPGMIKAGPITGGAVARLGIPGIRFTDGPRGVVAGAATAFPVSMARAATWDPHLEHEVGTAMGLEARAQGANYSGAVCINLLRHPAWGRAQESYGEDPVLTGRMGAGLTRGLRPNVMACVKHFALNSMENARFKVDVKVDDHALHEVYLPHFKTVIGAGAESVMSAYNSVNGQFMDVNKVLLTDILREEWGFEGFVTSDWVFGTHDGVASLEAGMDIEMPLRLLRAKELPAALQAGRLSRDTVLLSARRILRTVLHHAATRVPEEPAANVLASAAHRALARRVAARAMVLLKNDDVDGTPVLPLPPSITRLAVIGRLADQANTGDHGSSLVHPPSTSSPLEGLREALPQVEIIYADGTDVAVAADAASRADAVIVVAGMGHDDEGERVENDDIDLDILGFPFNFGPFKWVVGKLTKLRSQFGRGGDRDSLALHPADEQLVTAVAAANPRTAVVLIGGSAIIVESWKTAVPAILHAWYPGMEGGRALADVLTGAVEPGGRLPVAVPADAAHLPCFDPEASSIVYDASWGQRKLDRDGHLAAFPFGFGLGYTTFEQELVDHVAGETSGTARVEVRNTGQRPGSAVVQVYAMDADAVRPVPQLIGFSRVELAAGDVAVVDVELDLTPTRERDPHTRAWSRRPGTWTILAAAHSPATYDGAKPLTEEKS